MSQVPLYEQGEKKLEVFTRANDLVAHTIHVCANPKTFPPEFYDSVTSDLIATAKEIYLDAWEANNIRVTDGRGNISPGKADDRRKLQEQSIRKCGRFLALLQIAKRACHLSSKRVKYWTKLTKETREKLTAWMNNDAKRYDYR